MKVTFLSDLVLKREVVPVANMDSWVEAKVVPRYLRSPLADELIAVSSELVRFYDVIEEPIEFSLEPIGTHPSNFFYWVCSRTDSGPFWRAVAIAKYKLLLAQCKLTDFCFRHLYLWGLVVLPLGEEFSWKHLRLDWLLILDAIGLLGLIGCSLVWVFKQEYWLAINCLVASFGGVVALVTRRDVLVAQRDRELRETTLRQLFQFHGVTPTPDEFTQCLHELVNSADIIAIHQARHLAEQRLKANYPCHYYSANSYLPCAVYPDHHARGLCGEGCPGFVPNATKAQVV